MQHKQRLSSGKAGSRWSPSLHSFSYGAEQYSFFDSRPWMMLVQDNRIAPFDVR
jgi:hypothetical protein